MLRKTINFITIILLAPMLFSCSKDLSPSTYTTDNTMNIVLEGRLLTKRNVTIKEHEKLQDNTTGAAIGAIGGGLATARGTNNLPVVVGGAVVGGVAGAIAESAFGTAKGIEYIVEIDRSKLKEDYYEGSRMMRNAISAARATGIITVIQGKEDKNNPIIQEGQRVLVIISEKRSRVIPSNF